MSVQKNLGVLESNKLEVIDVLKFLHTIKKSLSVSLPKVGWCSVQLFPEAGDSYDSPLSPTPLPLPLPLPLPHWCHTPHLWSPDSQLSQVCPGGQIWWGDISILIALASHKKNLRVIHSNFFKVPIVNFDSKVSFGKNVSTTFTCWISHCESVSQCVCLLFRLLQEYVADGLEGDQWRRHLSLPPFLLPAPLHRGGVHLYWLRSFCLQWDISLTLILIFFFFYVTLLSIQ